MAPKCNDNFRIIFVLAAFAGACGSNASRSPGDSLESASGGSSVHASPGGAGASTCTGSQVTGPVTPAAGGGSGASTTAGSTNSSGNTGAASQLPAVAPPNQPALLVSGLTWQRVSGERELFTAAGPLLTELIQGTANDCTAFAAVACIVSQDPNQVKEMVVPVGVEADGSVVYRVRLYDQAGAEQNVLVDEKLATAASGQTPYDVIPVDASTKRSILWPSLIQKAVALHYNGYEAVLQSIDAQVRLLSGQTDKNIALFEKGDAAAVTLEGAAGHGYIVTVDSPSDTREVVAGPGQTVSVDGRYICLSGSGLRFCMVMGHVYSVMSFDGDTIVARNPWGTNIGDGVLPDGLVQFPFEFYRRLTGYTFVEAAPTLILKK